MTVALSADRSLRELTEFANFTVKLQLERAGGVGEVNVVGDLQRAINVWIEAERLAAYRIPITQVRQALERQNADVPEMAPLCRGDVGSFCQRVTRLR